MTRQLQNFLGYFLLAFAIVACTVGCGQMSVGPNSEAAKAYATIAEARSQTTILLTADKLTSTQGQSMRENLRTAQEAVDAYTRTQAVTDLDRAHTIISAVRTFLTSKGATFK